MAALGLIALLIQVLIIAGIVAGVVLLVNKKKKGSGSGTVVARDVLTHLLITATLYLTVVGVLVLIWGLADYWFPEFPDAGAQGVREGPMRAGISMAVVAFPVFVYMSIYTRKRRSPETAGLRQVFAYLNLFVVMVTVLVDLMIVINSYLSGDLTSRFAVRAAGVMLMAALVFLYYRSDSFPADEEASVAASKQPEPQT
ncbi:MAG: DUF5671 domain-containing protein [Actinomycetota bacterium]